MLDPQPKSFGVEQRVVNRGARPSAEVVARRHAGLTAHRSLLLILVRLLLSFQSVHQELFVDLVAIALGFVSFQNLSRIQVVGSQIESLLEALGLVDQVGFSIIFIAFW